MMMSKTLIPLAAVLFLGSGCAAMRAAQIRHHSIQNSLNSLSLSAPQDQVLNAARLMLIEQGFAPRDIGVGVVETDSRYTSSGSGVSASSTSWKYVVTASPINGGTKLTVMKNSQHSQHNMTRGSSVPSSARDFDLELEIVRRLEPDTAAKIEYDASVAAESASRG